MKTGVTESGSGFDFKAAFAFLREAKAVVGITAETAGRDGPVNNAQLLFIHSNGSPMKHIPARPMIEPALADAGVQQQIAEHMEAAIGAALEGDYGTAMNELDAAGQAGENAARANVTTIDTGALRNAITHEVRR